MSTTNKLPPAKGQKSTSGLSDPTASDEEILAEITVSFDAPPNSHISHSPEENDGDGDKMARTRGAISRKTPLQQDRPTQQNRPKRDSPVDDEVAETEIKVSPSASKGRTAAKRSQLSMPAKAASSAPPAAKKAKVTSRSKKWEPDNVTQNSRSPLVDVDLRALLLQPAAWDCLTAEDQKEIIALFPDHTHILDAGTPNARPNLESLRNDDNFRHDAEQYVTNLAKGMHDPTWLKDAWTAHHRRAAGDFDAFYIRKVEVDWNVNIPDELKPPHMRRNQSGESSAGHSDIGEGSSAERPGDVDADGETRNDAVKGDAVESTTENKVDLPIIKSTDATNGLDEGRESSAKDASTGPGSLPSRVGDEPIIPDMKLLESETNGGKSPADDTARDAPESILGSSENPFVLNGSEPIVVSGKATDPEDLMEVDGPEVHGHSG